MMSINKAQGQTLQRVGVLLNEPVLHMVSCMLLCRGVDSDRIFVFMLTVLPVAQRMSYMEKFYPKHKHISLDNVHACAWHLNNLWLLIMSVLTFEHGHLASDGIRSSHHGP